MQRFWGRETCHSGTLQVSENMAPISSSRKLANQHTQQKDNDKCKGWSQMAYQSTMSPLPHSQGFYFFWSYSKIYLKRLFWLLKILQASIHSKPYPVTILTGSHSLDISVSSIFLFLSFMLIHQFLVSQSLREPQTLLTDSFSAFFPWGNFNNTFEFLYISQAMQGYLSSLIFSAIISKLSFNPYKSVSLNLEKMAIIEILFRVLHHGSHQFTRFFLYS